MGPYRTWLTIIKTLFTDFLPRACHADVVGRAIVVNASTLYISYGTGFRQTMQGTATGRGQLAKEAHRADVA